jgi:hypothetical protein
MDLKELQSVNGATQKHWYYQSKAWALQKLVECTHAQNILDIGSGSGFFSKYLLENTSIEQAMCVDIGYEKDWDDYHAGKPMHFRKNIRTSKADLVLMMDVLEHVDNDSTFLRSYVDLSPFGTYFLITVPAFQFMWSGHDEFLGHKRRYTINQLESVVIASGLKIKSKNYYFGLVFPLALITRLTQKYIFQGRAPITQLDSHIGPINFLLKMICKLEISLMKVNQFAGLSVCILAKKVDCLHKN